MAEVKQDPYVQLHTTIYAVQFSPCGKYLVAANNFGNIALYNLAIALSKTGTEAERKPVYIFAGHDGPIYSLASNETFLISAGTGDVLGWRWKDIIDKAPKVAWSLSIPRGDSFESPETNGITLLKANADSTVYAGCGDCNIYGWELETGSLVSTFKGHTDYIHCLSAKNTTKELISGSEDGSVRIWDVRNNEEAVNLIEPFKHDSCSRPKIGKWISCVASDQGDDWLVCGGGPSLSLWHTRSLVQPAGTFLKPDMCQYRVLFYEDMIISGGSQPNILHWSINGDLIAEVPCSARTYDIQVNNTPDNNFRVLASAGSSWKIDICTNIKYKSFSFAF